MLLLLALGGLMHAARSFTEGAGAAGVELAFGFLLLVAFFNARFLHKLGLPHLTCYLLAGIITGPFVLDLVTDSMTTQLKVVSDVAVCMIALTAGAELNFEKIRPYMSVLRGMVFYSVIGTMFVLGGVLFLIRPLLPFLDAMSLDQAGAVCLMIGIAASAQSPSVVMAMVSELRSEGPVTRVLLAMVVVADFIVIICYAIASAVAGAVIGGDIDVGKEVASVSWELGGSIVFGVAIGAVLGVFLQAVKRGGSLFAVMVCLVVAEIGARIHLDPLITMIAAGVWLENFSKADSSKLLHDFESAQLPVFLVFFALAGSHINLRTLYASLLPVAIIVIARASSFFMGCRIATRNASADPAVRKYAWFGLVPQAGLAIAIALIMQKSFPSFGSEAGVLLLGVVAANELVAPPIFRLVMLRSGEAGKRAAADFGAHAHAPARAQIALPHPP
ncbi:MAG TPA: cation:proton antiporter [Kofleriaceae bacterium]|nr:cation:proton antiporter [Kofleriaceae bacterium]